MGRVLVAAVDDSPHSQGAGTWAALNFARPGDELHYVSIAPPPSYAMTPAAPIASAGAVAALSINWEQQRKADEELCRQLLHQAGGPLRACARGAGWCSTPKLVDKLPEGVKEGLDIHRHVLPAAGGASGVAESVVCFCKEKGADLVVVGSRGMGAVKSAIMSLVGLGSVSSYLVHNMHVPVAVCRGRPEDVERKARHKVMVSLDDSETSRTALEWVVQNALGPEDELHLVCVALPIPYPVSAYVDNHLPQPDVQGWRQRQRAALREAEAVTRRSLRRVLAEREAQVSPAEEYTSPPLPPDEWEASYRGSMQHTQATVAAAVEHASGPLQIVAEDAVSSEVLEADEFDSALQDSIHYAREVVSQAVDAAAVKVDKAKIFFKALAPEGGASGTPAALPCPACCAASPAALSLLLLCQSDVSCSLVIADVGESVVHYARENGVDLVAMGARGMGSFKRAMMSFVGLGSVSDYCVGRLECPVIVVKS
ncbi:hypothetical protein CHLNCDRAFT_139849 [Chlorella variabilis]|uniref:UspA domain-containing protein n=1 Tax=Chlorella variabilis TaxID=554065 RepID=E1ZR23_CHLVA|nr:hypothetical protein CHLNCDRAFT_139849 [Chlorella variabilis]EFN51655.1 hypothetical protein CHLNCDRAFT_139849 [Chlorella variabilis]|eukprot:XP_005843757.1 hypothetical protein CHLNCDRAFT_139849 [Chlorella variabilis]